MPTVKIHPLGEILSAKLFHIEICPPKEQRRMVNRAIKAAIAEYDKLEEENNRLRDSRQRWRRIHQELVDLLDKRAKQSKKEVSITCFTCTDIYTCDFAMDAYNISGKCLARK